MYYYAYLSRFERIVENVIASETQLTDENYVEITEAQYNAREIIGLQYNAETQTFAAPTVWSCATSDIDYRSTGVGLVKKLDEMEISIATLLQLLLTDENGRQKLTITGDVLTTIAGLSAGVHTCYSAGGSSATATNAPNTIESWRYLIHKNYPAYGWVMAFGSEGSVFTNYYDAGTWRGWKPVWDNHPSPLWSGASFMREGQTATLSKNLSECRNGIVLLWSNYDTSTSVATDGDVVATYIPKKCYDGENWSGHSWLVDLPIEITNASPYTETRGIKKIYVWNDKLTGHAANSASPRNNAVLRAIYEY